MPKKPPTSPRKSPKQERSRALVDTILTATARVLAASGTEAATTNRIAEIAGVSVGSLYQYFPNKESLIAGLIEAQIEKNAALVEKRLAELGQAPLEEVIDVIVGAVVERYAKNRKLVAALFEQAPRLEKVRNALLSRRHVGGVLRRALEPHRARLRVKNPELATYLLVHGVMGVVQATLFDPPEGVSEAELSAEISDLVKRYLL